MGHKVKIYYHDTDSGGVVYYGNYLKYLEEARTEFFDERGVSIKGLSEKGILFVVARQEIDYKAPAFYGDVLSIETRVAAASGVKIEFECDISNQAGQIVSKAKTILVCVDRTLRPKPIPEDIRGRITAANA